MREAYAHFNMILALKPELIRIYPLFIWHCLMIHLQFVKTLVKKANPFRIFMRVPRFRASLQVLSKTRSDGSLGNSCGKVPDLGYDGDFERAKRLPYFNPWAYNIISGYTACCLPCNNVKTKLERSVWNGVFVRRFCTEQSNFLIVSDFAKNRSMKWDGELK